MEDFPQKKYRINLFFKLQGTIETYFLSFVQHIRWSDKVGCNR